MIDKIKDFLIKISDIIEIIKKITSPDEWYNMDNQFNRCRYGCLILLWIIYCEKNRSEPRGINYFKSLDLWGRLYYGFEVTINITILLVTTLGWNLYFYITSPEYKREQNIKKEQALNRKHKMQLSEQYIQLKVLASEMEESSNNSFNLLEKQQMEVLEKIQKLRNKAEIQKNCLNEFNQDHIVKLFQDKFELIIDNFNGKMQKQQIINNRNLEHHNQYQDLSQSLFNRYIEQNLSFNKLNELINLMCQSQKELQQIPETINNINKNPIKVDVKIYYDNKWQINMDFKQYEEQLEEIYKSYVEYSNWFYNIQLKKQQEDLNKINQILKDQSDPRQELKLIGKRELIITAKLFTIAENQEPNSNRYVSTSIFKVINSHRVNLCPFQRSRYNRWLINGIQNIELKEYKEPFTDQIIFLPSGYYGKAYFSKFDLLSQFQNLSIMKDATEEYIKKTKFVEAAFLYQPKILEETQEMDFISLLPVLICYFSDQKSPKENIIVQYNCLVNRFDYINQPRWVESLNQFYKVQDAVTDFEGKSSSLKIDEQIDFMKVEKRLNDIRNEKSHQKINSHNSQPINKPGPQIWPNNIEEKGHNNQSQNDYNCKQSQQYDYQNNQFSYQIKPLHDQQFSNNKGNRQFKKLKGIQPTKYKNN